MSSAPEVSVVIPTRDRWELLSQRALPSVLGQAEVALEVIVVDDGSVSAPSRPVEGRRVTLLRHDRPRGPAAARNAGIAVARGEWVAFLDDDDVWAPRRLRTQLDLAGDAGWVYGAVVVVDEQLHPIDMLPLTPPGRVLVELRTGNVVGGGSAVMVRTELVRRVGGFDESLYYLEDWDLWLRLALESPAAVCPELLVATVDHPSRALFRDRKAVMRGVEELLRRTGASDAARRSAFEWIANEHHRGGRRIQASLLYLRTAIVFRSPGNLPPAVGALFGDRGMRVGEWLLASFGRGSHLDLERNPPVEELEWLVRLRAETTGAGE